MFRLACFALVFAACSAQLLREAEPFDPNPQYSFNYNIQDPLTGDAKSQQESRNGDSVQGSYSLVEPDGSVRTVEYTADAVNGFNAVVSKSGAGAPIARALPVARVAPVARSYVAAPVARSYVAPIPVARSYSTAPAVISSSFASPYASYGY
ncbi:hypothetical protein GE061_005335 [Apolygus lucorum]|uniref:Cuticle protein n=1 Tax=Apolygus lucorum TaxID=248454 RepID=A0A8S9WXR0_APOLU|nr:hypothetical protein GE061_005335 [Apolygus lucorum]